MADASAADLGNFSDRLRAERERLGLTQTEFGRLGSVSKITQWQYEQGRYWPSMQYVEELAAKQVDVVFLVTGHRLSTDRLDWIVLRDAFLFVQRSFVRRRNRKYTDEQLFDVFKSVVETSMALTRPNLHDSNRLEVNAAVEKA
jgi:transcriptional regulator with XRE-family HTH domain